MWAPRGTRPRRWRQTEYKWVYLFGAACPASGAAVGWIMPTGDTYCMNLHLQDLSRAVAADVQIALVLDNAGWHVSRGLRVPDNITQVPLPPYSPELNPPRRNGAGVAVSQEPLPVEPGLRRPRRPVRRRLRRLEPLHCRSRTGPIRVSFAVG